MTTSPYPHPMDIFQARVQPWMLACFGEAIAADKVERADRFVEEALELVQATGYGADRAHALVDYVFGRPKGEPHQEAGGVMVTLAAFCLAAGLDMHQAGEDELARIWTKVDAIRAKQAAKPTGSALPVATSDSNSSRVQDLLEANNRYLQRARDAEAEVETLRRINANLMGDVHELAERTDALSSEIATLQERYISALKVAARLEGENSIERSSATAARSLCAEMGERLREAVTTNHPRPLAEWKEDDGDVVWWTWRDGEWLGEPAYIGSPLCLGFGVPVSVGENEFVANVGGWPGYHTHWTPHPPFPDFTSREPENG